MKKLILTALTLCAVSAGAHAESLPSDGQTAANIEQPKRTHFFIGASSHKEKYEEFMPSGGKFMQETATLNGVTAGVSHDVWTASTVGATLTYAQGQSKYVGAYQNGNYGDLVLDGQDRQFIDFKTQLKLSAPAWQQAHAIVGLGYRKLTDHLEQGGPGGYERINRRVYGMLGGEYTFKPSNSWNITPRGLYLPSIKSENYTDLDGGIKHEQQGYGLEAAVDFTFTKDRFNVNATPFYRRWNIEDSDVVSGTYEPRNITREYGVAVSVGF